MRPSASIAWAWTMTGLLHAAGGCASSNPYSFASPPTVERPGQVSRVNGVKRPVIVIGEFANPPMASLNWSDVGRGVSDSLARTMFNDGRFDVWLRPELSRQVETILRDSPARRDEELGKLRRANPDVDFVLTGRVTDFVHTRDLPKDLARRGLFGAKQHAFVAVQMDLVDLATRRIIGISHIYGTAPADERPTADSYRSVRIGSYLFWSTPLGKATRRAIEGTVTHLAALVPGPALELRIVDAADTRRITINGGSEQGLLSGERFYLVASAMNGSGSAPGPVLDPDTRQPVQARITEVQRHSATAWLLGKLPPELDLRDVVLSRQLPTTAPAPAPAAATPHPATALANPGK